MQKWHVTYTNVSILVDQGWSHWIFWFVSCILYIFS